MNDYQRIDQWLWHVRIFKTRLLSSKSIMSGNIEIDQSKIKKNHVNVRVGNKIKIIKNNLSQEVEILQLTKRRISPKEVDKFYIMHSCSISTKYIKTQNDMLKNKTQRIGKLNKKERREINKFKEKNNFE
jgi:ribosome-associated heat shock protein Hsp15